MYKILNNLNEILKRITEPNAKHYPDPLVRQFIWSRNITCIYICFFFLFSVSVFLSTFNFSAALNWAVMMINIWVLFFFLVLCRSHLLIFNLIYVGISLWYGWGGFVSIPEAPFVYTGYIFMIITCILVYSGNVWMTLFTGAFHIFLCLTKFKEKLAVLIQEKTPEEFADLYITFVIFFFILMMFASIGLVKTLDKKSVELLQAKSALEIALEQQKTFIFSFSHELRNPINSLLGNLQLVLQGGEKLSGKAVEMISTAKVCGGILLHNINNVLDTGKYDIGKLEVNPVSTQLSELFQRTWGIYSELLRQKRLKSLLKIDKDLPAMVRIDPHKVNQILLNLIGNAIKFTEKGSVTVTVKWLKHQEINEKCFEPVPYDDMDEGLFEKEENLSTMMDTSRLSDSKPSFLGFGNERRSLSCDQITPSQGVQQEPRGILKIIVKDTGCGIKEEALEKLFQKFSQVSEHVSQRQIGTGLGLFITREICLAMKGEIRAYSKFGVGSTFVICIPANTVASESMQRAGSEAIIDQLTQKHLKAIVADDSPFNVNLISNYFSQFGTSVVSVAYNGYDIFTKYKEKMSSGVGIDVVTLDIDMPVMDGRKACDNIRQYEREHGLKPAVIILISGNYDKEQVEEYVNPEKGHKADCFLRKPVSFLEFSRAVYNLVNHDR